MTEAAGTSFLDALRGRVEASLDACTRCGKCVVACPMVEPAGIDTGRDGERAPAIAAGLMDLVSGGPGTPEAERWAQVCTNSGKCIPACDYGVNPRFLVNMARIAVKARAGEAAVRKGAQQYFTGMARNTRIVSRLQLAVVPQFEISDGASADKDKFDRESPRPDQRLPSQAGYPASS